MPCGQPSDLLRLTALGWDEAWAAALAGSADYLQPGRVTRVDRGGVLTVAGGHGDARAKLGRALVSATAQRVDLPTVGDWVGVGPGPDGAPEVATLLPRRSAFVRHASRAGTSAQVLAANVDTALVLVSLQTPLHPRRLERYLTLAWQGGAVPVVVLTKADECPDLAGALSAAAGAAPGVEVCAISAVTGQGVEALRPWLQSGRTVVLLGQSGVGKSTLANRLLDRAELATATVRADGKGRHTTAYRQLVVLPDGGVLIDTPGLRSVLLWNADDGAAQTFADVEALAGDCRFRDCAHDREPGCAVKAGLADGSLPPDRLDSYRAQQRELAHLARKQDVVARRAQARKWGVIHREVRSLPKVRDR